MFHDLKKLLSQAAQRAGISRQIEASNVVNLFNKLAPEILGKVIAGNAKAVYFKNNILTVECSSSLIMQEVRYREQEIIKELNQKSGGEIVEKIQYSSQ